jgi:transposase, IS6 family
MVDHTTVWRWCQKYGPMIYQRLRGKLKYTTTTWHMDETYVRIAGRWVYLFRAVDSHGDTVDFYLSERRDREAAKTFSAEGSSESGLPESTHVVYGQVPNIPRSDSRFASRRAFSAEVSTKDQTIQTIRQQSN